jgi:hypothetical protein
MVKFGIIDKIIELVIGLYMIIYGLFNAGGVMNLWTAVNTTNFSVLGFIFTSLGPLIVGFAVFIYVVKSAFGGFGGK